MVRASGRNRCRGVCADTTFGLTGIWSRRSLHVRSPGGLSQIASAVPFRQGGQQRRSLAGESFLEHLRTLASGEDSFYEQRRRQRFAQTLTTWRQVRLQQPQVLIEAPSQITDQEFATLPQGVELGPGTLSIRFSTTQEALEKLLALAMAIGRDFGEFERRTGAGNG